MNPHSLRVGPARFRRCDFYSKPFPSILDVSFFFDLTQAFLKSWSCMTSDQLASSNWFQLACETKWRPEITCPTGPYQSLARWCRPSLSAGRNSSLCAWNMNGLSLMSYDTTESWWVQSPMNLLYKMWVVIPKKVLNAFLSGMLPPLRTLWRIVCYCTRIYWYCMSYLMRIEDPAFVENEHERVWQ